MTDKGSDKPPKSIEDLLRLLSMGQELTETQEKQMKDYKFWKTQPVPSFDEKIQSEGPIDSNTDPEKVPNEPLPLLGDFEWCTVDIENGVELDEVYTLLYEHFVEDKDATLRFKYSHDFFNYALKPPGWKKEWYVGVRVKGTKKLVAFISAIPVTLKLNKSKNIIPSVEINFLCVHKKLRTKRLAPVLIKEITRRVNKENIWQALYTAGVRLPSPVSTCRYTHRPLNWAKLYDVGFSHLPQNQTKAGMVAHYSLPNATKTDGLRLMKKEDLDQVYDLLNKFQERFELIQIFEKHELAHWLLGSDSTNDENKVIKTYIVEKDGRISDFFSYYLLPFSVLQNPSHDELSVAYLFYYASDSAGKDGYKQRLNELMNDALVTAKSYGVDVFNCLTTQDNNYFINDAKFGAGNGFLNYYLFNYKTFPMSGGIDKNTKELLADEGSGVGVVLF